jgi:hypothetical protein
MKPEHPMNKLVGKMGALAAGALAMYYLDPQLGRERRALLAQWVAGGLRQPRRSGDVVARRLRTVPLRGAVDAASDAALRGAITARLGRLVSHPRAIDVRVENGTVRLSGDVLAKERDDLLLQVQAMPGVQMLVNAMTAHDSPAGIAALQAREEAAA